jgi:hypothetical protein
LETPIIPELPEPLNITNALTVWRMIFQALLPEVADLGIFNSTSNAASLGLSFGGIFIEKLYLNLGPYANNTPADGGWYIKVGNTDLWGDSQEGINIVFLPTGEVDKSTENLDFVNSQFDVAIKKTFDNNPENFWRFVNWFFVSEYWLTLYDCGQIAPMSYEYNSQKQVNLSLPKSFNEMYNIFVNNTLFQIYQSYLREIVVPIFGEHLGLNRASNSSNYILPQFASLNDTNQLQPVNETIYREYSCAKRQIKSWFSLIISVFAANYAIIAGAYKILIFICEGFQKQKDRSASISLSRLISRKR